MAQVTGAFSTYQSIGNREDLSNGIYNIDPFDTPVMSMAGRRNVKERSFDWQSEHLPLVDPNNAQIEGFQLTATTGQPTVRLTNTTQISKRDATVTGSQESAVKAGRGSEMAHQLALKSKVLKSDMETIMCSRQPLVAGSDTVARTTEAICHFVARGIDRFGVQGTAVQGYTATGLPAVPTDAFTAVIAGNQVSLTETLLGNAMQAAYVNGASPTMMIVPPSIKRNVSTFVGRSTTQVLVGKTEVISTVDVIATDFGRIKIMPSRWLATDTALIMDPGYVSVGFFRNFRQIPLAKVGDAETRMIVAEWGVEMKNPLAHIFFNGVK